jgi:AraC-like DNA-binding protein
MAMQISTEHLPPTERFAYFRELSRQLPELVDLSYRGQDFNASMCLTELGGIGAMTFNTGPISFEVRRTQELIRRSDPEYYRLLLGGDGATAVEQADRQTVLTAGQMAIYDTSLPSTGWRRTPARQAELIMMDIPRAMVSLRPDKVRRIVGERLPDTPAAALLATVLRQVARDARRYEPIDASRISAVVLDLLSIVLSGVLDERRRLDVGSDRSALLMRIHAYIENRLDDPALSPGAIAAAHHIAIRTLHRLFEEQGISVRAYIRQRRLDRCRRDLADPSLRGRPIRTIAARWGFADHSHLTRTFQAAYGIAPKEYRAQHGHGHPSTGR